MKNRSLLMLALFVFLIACNKDESQKEFTAATEDIVQTEWIHPLINYVAPNLPVINSRSNGNPVTKTLKVKSATGTNWIEAPIGCPEGSAFRVMVEGGGIYSHLGRVTGFGTLCADEYGNPTTLFTVTDVAANGDEMYGYSIFAGVGDDPPHNPDHADYPYHEDLVYEGGTGRFVDLTGEVTLFGEVVFPTEEEPIGSYDFWGEGTITY